MPEAPINEDRDPRTDEDKICSPSNGGYRPCVNPVSQATRVHQPPDLEFWLRVASAITQHGSTGPLRGRPRLRHESNLRLTFKGRVAHNATGHEPRQRVTIAP